MSHGSSAYYEECEVERHEERLKRLLHFSAEKLSNLEKKKSAVCFINTITRAGIQQLNSHLLSLDEKSFWLKSAFLL